MDCSSYTDVGASRAVAMVELSVASVHDCVCLSVCPRSRRKTD